jgi:hypothetical protein
LRWLALTGEQSKVIQTVMRHCSITLTMDTYGHLLPEQQAEAIANLPAMFGDNWPLSATGTADFRVAVEVAVGG